MSTPLVVAVDCSTTAAKAIVVNPFGQVVASGACALDTRSPAPHHYEQYAPDWWSATDRAVREALATLDDTSGVTALCVTHQRETFVCLDEYDEPLRPAILWMDGRASDQVERLGGEWLERLSGKPGDITPGLYKIAWLRDHEPDVLKRTTRLVDVHGYLVHAMTGRWASSVASVDPLALLDLAQGDYSPALLEVAGLRRDQLVDLVPTGTPIAPLAPAVAAAWGLPASVHVVAGLGDGQAAGLGLGITRPGAAYLVLGTAVVIGSETADYLPTRAFRSMISPFPGQTTIETFCSSGTYLPTWFRREFGDPALDGAPDPALEQAAAAVPPGCERLFTVPYWNAAQTPYWDIKASGVTIGWRGIHTKAHLYRSLLEGIAFELRIQLEGIEHALGQRIELIRAMGGGARSALWTQIVADVLGRPIEVCVSSEASALGAAAVALTATGEVESLAEASDLVAVVDAVVRPRPVASATYTDLFAVYQRIYAQTRELMYAVHDLPPGGVPSSPAP